MKKIILVPLVFCFYAGFAQADSYTVMTTRVAGELSCVFDKANGGSLQCSEDYQSQIALPIAMNSISNGGYVGIDQVSEGDTQYLLVLSADSTKKLESIVTMHFQVGEKGAMDGGLSGTNTNSLSVVNIAPFHVESGDGESIKIHMGFYAYAPASAANVVTAKDRHELTQSILRRVQPALMAIIK